MGGGGFLTKWKSKLLIKHTLYFHNQILKKHLIQKFQLILLKITRARALLIFLVYNATLTQRNFRNFGRNFLIARNLYKVYLSLKSQRTWFNFRLIKDYYHFFAYRNWGWLLRPILNRFFNAYLQAPNLMIVICSCNF